MRDLRYLDTRLGPTIQTYLHWKRLALVSDVTLDTYERILARLAVSLPPGVGIADVTGEHLERYLVEVPPGSWKLHRAALNGLFEWAINRDLRAAKNPIGELPKLLPKGAAKVYDVFTDREREVIIAASRLMDDPARDRVRAHLLLDSGIRKGEAIRLQQHDVNPAAKEITVLGKGSKERRIPIAGPFWVAWEDQLLTPYPRLGRLPEPDDYVWFPMRVAGEYLGRARQVTAAYPDSPASKRGFHQWWDRLISHTSVPYRKPHMTRHTFATAALDASSGDIYGVKELLGHASTTTTEMYLHSSARRKEAVAKALAKARRDASLDNDE